MIRFKDKIFEQYSICPATGEIFDSKTGKVQKITMSHGRPCFHCMPVHCIQAHTFYGFKDGYDVHHLDENPLNNALSNLVYLTHGEHKRLHIKGKPRSKETRAKISATLKGKPLSDETRAKISTAQKGKPHPHKGKKLGPLSAERKEKIAEATKNAMQDPKVRSKLSNAKKDSHWWHLPSGETKQAKESPGPEWLPGRK